LFKIRNIYLCLGILCQQVEEVLFVADIFSLPRAATGLGGHSIIICTDVKAYRFATASAAAFLSSDRVPLEIARISFCAMQEKLEFVWF
jgi:hypothetical protein